MEALPTVVIKVKYGDMLRRFNAPIVDDKLSVNIDRDVVALVDDDDLRDVVKQGLNPVRVTVTVNSNTNGNQTYTNVSSTPVHPLPNLTSGVSEVLSIVPEPLREALVKLSEELASKATSSSPGICDMVDNLSKISLSYLGQRSDSAVMSNAENAVPGSSSAADNKYSEHVKVAATVEKPETYAGMERKEIKIKNVTGPRKDCPTFDFNAVAAALESENSSAKPESGGVPYAIRSREKVRKNDECSNGKLNLTSNPPAVAINVGKSAEVGPNLHYQCEKATEFGPNPRDQYDTFSNHVNVPGNVRSSVIDDFKKETSPCKGGESLGSLSVLSGMNECPFSGTPLENISAAPPLSASEANLFRRGHYKNDSSGNSVFHRGVCCDGCGIHPIVGPRFKSKVKVNYDLCRVCYDKMGNANDYVIMETPVVYRHHLPHFRVRDQGVFPHVYRGYKVKLSAGKLDCRFIQDVNIFDGTVMAPFTPFTKIWRMRNNGRVAWPQKTQLVWIGGDKLTDTLSTEVQISAAGLQVDQELDVTVDFISPELPGRYISYWRMASPSGQKFGQRVWVLIQVDASTVNESPSDTVRNLNLNLPPASSYLNGLETISMDCEAVAEGSRQKADNSKNTQNTENELKFPINDSLLVGNGAGWSSSHSPASSSAAYPIIDLTDMEPPVPSRSPAMSIPMLLPPPPPPPAVPIAIVPESVELPEKHLMEDKLLKELAEMGFKQVDLNKEVLRMNEYDLEQAVDDLCGVAEWDPILEELEEMGFHNTEMNKKLLKKNNGSIKRVVMDLIAGEEDV
ncbi:protein JOKA2 isoform X1 [Salvia divinorum]|uniref:Protein JOKA2 isoform X1 n=1 Tax=Salvia divinorum TaxID=28513 RepID=A0ABD1I6K7_SALDI